ncbi:MAG: hypothetical protein Q8S22_12080, partial [Eubacteriales bacterium]|nr:hypothetical protein [Eubacteriales bacterium]
MRATKCRELRPILDGMPYGYAYHELIMNTQGNPCGYIFRDMNKQFELFTGLQAKEVIGKNVFDVVPNLINDKFDWVR